MARRRKGRPLSGWLVVDKPAGIGSTDVVNKARWLLSAQKAGHAGTLDPAATGVLVLAFGEATKALPFITDAAKAYTFTIAWGAATTTDDAEGEVLETSAARPTEAQIRAALPAFTGEISQIPPAFSAVRVDGRRAHDLAREGTPPDLAPRPLTVHELTLEDIPDPDHAVLTMVCGKGGYVRAIARDLGRHLGCLGHTATLRRLWSGPFRAEDALPWVPDLAPETVEAAVLPLEQGLAHIPRCRCTEAALGALRNGNPAEVAETTAENGQQAWASVHGQAMALGTYAFGMFTPTRVFNRPPPAA